MENEWFNSRNINSCYPLGTLRAMVNIMDEIEAGLKKIEEKIKDLKALEEKRDSLSQEIRDHDAELLTTDGKTRSPRCKDHWAEYAEEGQTGH